MTSLTVSSHTDEKQPAPFLDHARMPITPVPRAVEGVSPIFLLFLTRLDVYSPSRARSPFYPVKTRLLSFLSRSRSSGCSSFFPFVPADRALDQSPVKKPSTGGGHFSRRHQDSPRRKGPVQNDVGSAHSLTYQCCPDAGHPDPVELHFCLMRNLATRLSPPRR